MFVKIKAYNDNKIFWRHCTLCTGIQEIKQGMNDETWFFGQNWKQMKEEQGLNFTSSYCPEHEAQKRAEIERLRNE